MSKILEFIKFGMVGIINTLTSFSIYYILIACNVNYLISNIFAYFISSIIGYILNKTWVFKHKDSKPINSVIKYYTTYASSFLLSTFLMYILVDIFNISVLLAPVLTLGFTVPYNYIMSKKWTFSSSKK